jgi:O-antigen ligase
LVLATRLAGDESRREAVRTFAAATTAPLGMGLYLSFSRGSLFACAAGLVALVVLVPRRQQLAAVATSVLAVALAAVAVSGLHGVTSLAGSAARRERQGAIALALLVLVAGGAGLAQSLLARRVRALGVRLPRPAPLLATAAICCGLALAIVLGAKERAGTPLSSGSTRLVTLHSNRYAYWRVAVRAFRAHPIRGVGAGGWAVYWLRYRPFNDFAQDAHSLPLQTLAELGIVGLALLAVFLAGIGLAAREAYAAAPAATAGPAAGLVVWVAHAPLDWDWQMPAVTLVAIVLAGMLAAIAQREPASSGDARYNASAIRGASRLKIHTEATHTSR